MRLFIGLASTFVLGWVLTGSASAQNAAVKQAGAVAPGNAAAAIVNGQPVSEGAVQRALKRIPPQEHARARKEIVDFLIDNLLVEQYLVGQKVVVDPKEVQAKVTEIETEMKKQNQDFAKMLKDLNLSDEELRSQIAADLRWERFALSRATEPVLKEMFAKNQEMFNGAAVRARHILLRPPADDPKAVEAAKATLLSIKKEVYAAAEQAGAKMAPSADPLTRGQEKARAMEEAFAAAATKHSTCPSKAQGGDINWFPRAGSMVEPFAKAAFALKPFEMSDAVQTPFGYHLILVTATKPGQTVDFAKVQDAVKEMYCGQMRESLCGQLRQSAKISLSPSK